MREDVGTLAALIAQFDDWYADGILDDVAYGVLRGEYAARLQRLHLGRTPSSATAQATAAALAATGEGAPPADERRGPRAPSFDITAWAAERQADILLYLGAFLLVIAALIGTSYQGEALSGVGRIALLAGYTAGFVAAGVFARGWARVREAAPVFLALGALLTPLNFILLYVELLDDRGVAPDVVWLIGSVYSALFYAVLFARGLGRLYAVPAAVGAVSTWTAAAAVLDLPVEWLSAWFMAPAVVVAAATKRLQRLEIVLTVITGLVAAVVLVTSLVAADSGDHRAQLPVTWTLVTTWAMVAGVYWRAPAMVLVAATTAIGSAIGALWAFEVGSEWYVAPILVGGPALVVSRAWWAGWSPAVARAAWLYSAACALSPVVLAGLTEPSPWLASGGHLAGAAILGAIAWRNRPNAAAAEARDGVYVTPLGERAVFGWAAFGLLLAAVAYAQEALEVTRPDTGWAFLVMAATVIAAIGATARADERAVAVLLPPALVAVLVSLQPWGRFPGHDAVLLAIPALELLAVALFTRRWTLAAASLVAVGAAAAAAWHAFEWETWTLAVAYFGAGALLLVALAPLRSYHVRRAPSRNIALLVLSWGLALAAPIVAAVALADRIDGGVADGVATVEYRTFAFLLLALSALPALEGWRLRNWSVTAAATGLAAVAVATIWPAFGWETWTLAMAYGALGTLRFFLLSGQRTYVPSPQQAAIVALSWGPVLAAPLTAAIALNNRVDASEAAATVEYRTLVLFVLVVAALLAFEGRRLRNWSVITAGAALAAGGVAGVWPAFDWEAWTLAPVYIVAGGALFLALAPLRKYGSERRQPAIDVLSWGLLVVAVLTAVRALNQRVEAGAEVAVATVEYRTLILMVLAIAPAIAFEGHRFASGLAVWVATAVAAGATLMAIAILEPQNVQAYTAPAAAYLIASGLIIRRSEPVFAPHLLLHEVALIAGAMALVLPQAEQSFEPGGASWGFPMLTEALVFVAAALLLRARWLAVAGVLTASGVGGRWLAESGETVPYWMTLGVAGLLLLVLGVLLLVYRERWNRAQDRVFHWWQHAPLRG